MKVVFTKHTLERIKERNIKFEDIEKTLKYYDKKIMFLYLKPVSHVLCKIVSNIT